MKIGILKETFEREKRVSLVPENVPSLKKAGMDVFVKKAGDILFECLFLHYNAMSDMAKRNGGENL